MKLIVVVYVLAAARTLSCEQSLQFGTLADDGGLIIEPALASLVDPAATWQPNVFCLGDEWVQGFQTYQDDSILDKKGITGIYFSCAKEERQPPTLTASGDLRVGGHMIYSGMAVGTKMDPLFCPNVKQFVVGLEVTYCGSSYGACDLWLICDVPYDWSKSAEGKRGVAKPAPTKLQHTLDVFKRKVHARNNNWNTRGAKCADGYAVQGFSTKYHRVHNLDKPLTDESGINEIKFFCKPFPQPGLALSVPGAIPESSLVVIPYLIPDYVTGVDTGIPDHPRFDAYFDSY